MNTLPSDNAADGRIDPVDQDYKPLGRADTVSDCIFYATGVVSLGALLIDAKSSPSVYVAVQTLFALLVLALFAISLSIRLHLFPRAQNARYTDFVSHALGRPLTYKLTEGYYNNSQPVGWKRAAAQVLENSFYTRDTLIGMSRRARIVTGIYAVIWLLIALNRNTDLAVVGVAAQIVFSEQIISKWWRIEWLRKRCDTIYNELYRHFQSRGLNEALAWEKVGEYENTKATAAVVMSSGEFFQRAKETDQEWSRVRVALDL